MRRSLFPLLAAALAAALTLLAAEGALRVAGVGRWTPFSGFDRLPAMSLPHDTLGWVNKPGVYRWPGLEGDEALTVTIDPRGVRGPSDPPGAGRPLWFLGGSFVFGFGVDDRETLPAQLGGMRPDLAVSNLGVPGYGTVQSLSLFRERLRVDGPPAVVVYGLLDYHDARNVAAPSWLYGLDRAGGPNPWVKTPSATWDGVALSFHPPRGSSHWPLSERVALVGLTERALVALGDWGTEQKTETTVQLVKALRQEALAAGASFYVALLHAPEAGEVYARRLREEGIPLFDLRDPAYPGPGLSLGDGHPTAALYGRWAEALAAALP